MATPNKSVLNDRAALYAAEIDLKAAIFTLDRAEPSPAIKECRKVVFGALRAVQMTRETIEKRK